MSGAAEKLELADVQRSPQASRGSARWRTFLGRGPPRLRPLSVACRRAHRRYHAVQVREVRCRHGKDLSALVHSPPKKFGLPRGRCYVEPSGIPVAADEQIEYRDLRRHRGERSIRAGVLSLEAGWIDALQSGGRTCGPSSRRMPKGAWANRSSRRTSSSPSAESWSSRLPSSSCAFRVARDRTGTSPAGRCCRLRASERGRGFVRARDYRAQDPSTRYPMGVCYLEAQGE
jgi:hypothetical protein